LKKREVEKKMDTEALLNQEVLSDAVDSLKKGQV